MSETNEMDYFRVHQSNAVQMFLSEFGPPEALHSPDSQQLSPSDFHLFGKLEHQIIGLNFGSVMT